MAKPLTEVAKFWKDKAITRRMENKELKKRLKETKASRENWKKKSMHYKALANTYKYELQKIKKNLLRLAAWNQKS